MRCVLKNTATQHIKSVHATRLSLPPENRDTFLILSGVIERDQRHEMGCFVLTTNFYQVIGRIFPMNSNKA